MFGFLRRGGRFENFLRREPERAHHLQSRSIPLLIGRPVQRIVRSRARALCPHRRRARPIIRKLSSALGHVLSQRLQQRRRRIIRAPIRPNRPSCRHLHPFRRLFIPTARLRVRPNHFPIDDFRPGADARASSSRRRVKVIVIVLLLVFVLLVDRARVVIRILIILDPVVARSHRASVRRRRVSRRLGLDRCLLIIIARSRRRRRVFPRLFALARVFPRRDRPFVHLEHSRGVHGDPGRAPARRQVRLV